MSVVLRDYQTRMIDQAREAFRHHKRVLLQGATGMGKTILFGWLTNAAAAKGKRVGIGLHRRELLRQTCAKLDMFGLPYGVIAAGTKQVSHHAVSVFSVQTLVRRLEHYEDAFDLLILDEAHHAVAGTWSTILAAFPKARVLGVTATPERLDGRGLGDVFEDLIVGPSVKALVEQGYLADYVAYGPEAGPPDLSGIKTRMGDFDVHELADRMSQGKIVGDAVEHYRKLAQGEPGVAFCVSVAHAEMIAWQFRNAGYRATCVDGKMHSSARDLAFAGLENGDLDLLTSCQLIDEGVDIPGIKAVIDLSPTKSLSRFLQRIGRASRASGGKRSVILDHAGNIERHGLPDADRTWSLEGKKRKKVAARVKMCPECFAYVELGCSSCQECGHVFESKRSEEGDGIPETRPGQLVEVSRLPKSGPVIAAKLAEARSLADCRVLATRFGFQRGWAFHAWNAELARREAAERRKINSWSLHLDRHRPDEETGPEPGRRSLAEAIEAGLSARKV